MRLTLMPPQEGACPTCAHGPPAHHPDEPHNAESLYYKYWFYERQGRWPTWADAMEHCPEPVRAAWEAELRKLGKWEKP